MEMYDDAPPPRYIPAQPVTEVHRNRYAPAYSPRPIEVLPPDDHVEKPPIFIIRALIFTLCVASASVFAAAVAVPVWSSSNSVPNYHLGIFRYWRFEYAAGPLDRNYSVMGTITPTEQSGQTYHMIVSMQAMGIACVVLTVISIIAICGADCFGCISIKWAGVVCTFSGIFPFYGQCILGAACILLFYYVHNDVMFNLAVQDTVSPVPTLELGLGFYLAIGAVVAVMIAGELQKCTCFRPKRDAP